MFPSICHDAKEVFRPKTYSVKSYISLSIWELNLHINGEIPFDRFTSSKKMKRKFKFLNTKYLNNNLYKLLGLHKIYSI